MYADNVRLLQPTVLVARVCGVCPTALRKVWIPFRNKIYATVLALLAIFTILPYQIEWCNALNDITAFIFVCHWISFDIQLLTCLIMPFVFSEELVRFFVVIESVQRSLFGLNIRQLPHPSRRSQVVWITATFLLVISTCLSFLFLGFPWNILPVIPSAMVFSGSFLLMRALLDLLHEKFSLLVWHLDDLNDRWPLFLPRPVDVTFKEFTSVGDLRRTKFVLPNHDDRAVTVQKINEFNKAHLKLIYACKTLQKIYSIEWFVITISTSLQVIINTFLMSMTPGLIDKMMYILSISFGVWTFFVNLSLATKIKEKSDRVAILVHDLLDEDRHPPDVVEELEQFSLALLHRKANFSAAGFFDFDLKLVSKMASLVAPIVLFLVQNKNRPRAGRRRQLIAAAEQKQ